MILQQNLLGAFYKLKQLMVWFIHCLFLTNYDVPKVKQ